MRAAVWLAVSSVVVVWAQVARGQHAQKNVNATSLSAKQLAALGEGLMSQYFAAVVEADGGQDDAGLKKLKGMMDEGYQIVRGDFSRDTKDTYTPPRGTQFTITDMVATAPSPDVLVLRYNVLAKNESQFGNQLGAEKAPRLTVFRQRTPQEGGGWKVVSHANFNRPSACGKVVSPVTHPLPPGDLNATALATQITEEFWGRRVVQGTEADALSPAMQGVYPDGSGFTGANYSSLINASSFEVSDVVATLAGPLLVVSFEGKADDLTIWGHPSSTHKQPRLSTFLQNGGVLPGGYTLISNGAFNFPDERKREEKCPEQVVPPDPFAGAGARRSGTGGGGGRRPGAGALLAATVAAALAVAAA